MVSRSKVRVSCLYLCLVISILLNPDQVCAAQGVCPFPTIPAQVTYRDNWLLGWAAGSPPQQIQKNTRVEIAVVGVFPKFSWDVGGDGATIQTQDDNGSIAEIFVECSGTDLVAVTVTDEYGFELAATIAVVDEPFEWDAESTGTGAMAPNSQKDIHVKGGSPIYAWSVSGPGFWLNDAYTTQSITTDDNIAVLYTDEDACGPATVRVTDGCGNKTAGSVTADCPAQCPPAVAISYDWGGSIKTMGRNASAAVAVQAGQGPYTWEISRNGFDLASSVTTGVANTISTNSSACGSGYITVTDACGEVAEGVVRCSAGSQWWTCGYSSSYIPLANNCTSTQYIVKDGHRIVTRKCCKVGDWCFSNIYEQASATCDDGQSVTLHIDEISTDLSCTPDGDQACDPWKYRFGRFGGAGFTIQKWVCSP